MNLVDSSGWLEYFMNGPLAAGYAVYLQRPKDVITPTIVLYEVYKKLKAELDEERALWSVAQINRTTVVPLSETVALQAADISLEKKLPMADSIIYATACAYGAKLITSDADFKGLPQVTYLEDPFRETSS